MYQSSSDLEPRRSPGASIPADLQHVRQLLKRVFPIIRRQLFLLETLASTQTGSLADSPYLAAQPSKSTDPTHSLVKVPGDMWSVLDVGASSSYPKHAIMNVQYILTLLYSTYIMRQGTICHLVYHNTMQSGTLQHMTI